MPALPRDFGQKLLSGAAGPTHAERAERIRAVVRTVVGEAPPSAPPLPELRSPAPPKLFPLRGNARERVEAEKLASAALEGFLTRELAVVSKHAQPALWMLWPDGQLSKHATPTLLDALAKRDGKAAPIIQKQKRSYNASEMRSVLARGIPEGIEAMFGVQNALAVTIALEGKRGPAGTAMMIVSPDQYGDLKVHNVMLPSIDEAVRASAAPSLDSEDEAVRFADRIVRHFVLGHDRHLRALKNHFCEKVLMGEDVVDLEGVVERASFGAHRLDANDFIFGGSARGAIADMPGIDRLKRRTKEIWGKPFEKLQLCVVETKIDQRVARSIMLRVNDRWRLAAIER